MIFVDSASDADISITAAGSPRVYWVRGNIGGATVNLHLHGAGVVRAYLLSLWQTAGAFKVFDMTGRVSRSQN